MNDRAERVDREQEQARRTLADYLQRWRLRSDLSMREIEILSLEASGRARLTGNMWTKIKACVEGTRQWIPHPATLLALDDLQQLILDWTERGTWPGTLDTNLRDRLQPFVRVDGLPMERLDWFAALIGEPGVISVASPTSEYGQQLAALAPRLGAVIERAMVDAGLSPIRDLDLLLAAYPISGDRLRLRAVVLGDAVMPPEELHLNLPGIATALSEVTGQDWTWERLVGCGNGQPNGLPS